MDCALLAWGVCLSPGDLGRTTRGGVIAAICDGEIDDMFPWIVEIRSATMKVVYLSFGILRYKQKVLEPKWLRKSVYQTPLLGRDSPSIPAAILDCFWVKAVVLVSTQN